MPGAGAEAFRDEVEGGNAAIVTFVVFGEKGGDSFGEVRCADAEETNAAIEVDDR